MKKISKEECIELIKEKFPEFIPYWEKFIRDFDSEEGIIIQMIPFEEYTLDRMKSHDESELKRIFDLVEFFFCNGDEKVKNAMSTGFLEYLLSQDPDVIKFNTIVKYLGEQSIGYCRAWDRFNGIRTEGLWDEK